MIRNVIPSTECRLTHWLAVYLILAVAHLSCVGKVHKKVRLDPDKYTVNHNLFLGLVKCNVKLEMSFSAVVFFSFSLLPGLHNTM